MRNKWIRTSEKLPELIKKENNPIKNSQSVMIVNNAGDVYGDMTFYEVSGEQYFENYYEHPVRINISDVKFWMYEPEAPRHRTECLNCKINDTCQDAYDNVCGGVSPCHSCANRHTSFSKEPCMSCGEYNNGCKWRWKDWSEK